jgi:hypothetical protein
MSAPFKVGGNWAVAYTEGGVETWDRIEDICRPPVLKTFRLRPIPENDFSHFVKAESKEAALAKLSASLEEVRSSPLSRSNYPSVSPFS